ncbi:MAG: EF-P beta-lysylation protein EpmB [Gammaproteobacteria bacterium]
MIQQISPPWQTVDWQNALKSVITSPDELIGLLNLPESMRPALHEASLRFGLRVPKTLLNRIEKGNPHDPVLQQFLPVGDELKTVEGYVATPLEEDNHNPQPGLLHKYASRVLLITIGSCAVNCRYCFRRNFAYKENTPGKAGMAPALDYIRQDASIEEVILSGGDPLNLSDGHLHWLLTTLAAIPHVKTIRFHTRTPVVIPARITTEFLNMLDTERFQFVFVLHINHAQEIDAHVQLAMQCLRQKALLLNQSVLLKGINDTLETQVALCRRLIAIGVIPYYLHLLDKVAGAHHFDVDEANGVSLITGMQRLLPGYAVPRLAREIPGNSGKKIVI